MENKEKQVDKIKSKIEIEKDYRKKQSDLMMDLRFEGPSINRTSVLMWFLQAVSIIGGVLSVAWIIYAPFADLQIVVLNASLSICGVSIIFFVLTWWLSRTVRRRNRFILRLMDLIETGK